MTRAAHLLLALGAADVMNLPALVLYPQGQSGTLAVARHVADSDDVREPTGDEDEIKYARNGTAVYDARPRGRGEDGVNVLKACASTHQIDQRRRVMIVFNAGALVLHAQHALRKVVEGNMATSMFVLVVDSPSQLDSALRSRSVILNCVSVTRSIEGASRPQSTQDDPATEIVVARFLSAKKELSEARARGAAVLTRERTLERATKDVVKSCSSHPFSVRLVADALLRLSTGDDECREIVSRAARADAVRAQMQRLGAPKCHELPLRMLLE